MSAIEKYSCIFFVYSIAGWFMESFRGWAKTGKFVNRGFLIGPYLPVYGCGVTLITIFLEKYVNDIGILFGMSIILCGALEYFTSWIMEKLFKARWWDYHNRKFNINGRICLETLIPFGILGTVLLKYANPFILGYLEKIPPDTLIEILKFLIIVIAIDIIISFRVMLNFKKTAKKVEAEGTKDNTEEMNEVVKETAKAKAQEIKAGATEVIEDINSIIVKGAVHISNTIKYNILFKNNKEYTEAVKAEFKAKSWLTKRLTEAYPGLIVISKKFKNSK